MQWVWSGLAIVGLSAAPRGVAMGSICQKASSFFEFDLPITSAPFTGTLSLFGDGYTGGELEVSGIADMTVTNASPPGSTARIDIKSLNLDMLYFVFENQLYDNFTIDNSNPACSTCRFKAKIEAKRVPPCPFETNLLEILEGDDGAASGHAVKFVAKALSDSYDLSDLKNEISLISYGELGNNNTVKLSTFSEQKTNNNVRSIIHNLTNFNSKSVQFPEAYELAFEQFSTEARDGRENVVVLLTDGFKTENTNPEQLTSALAKLKKVERLRMFIVATDGDFDLYRKILKCPATGPCEELVVLDDVSRASAEQAAVEISALTCQPPSTMKDLLKKGASSGGLDKIVSGSSFGNLPSMNGVGLDKLTGAAGLDTTATLLTFAVTDDGRSGQHGIQNIAEKFIGAASQEMALDKSNFELLDVKSLGGGMGTALPSAFGDMAGAFTKSFKKSSSSSHRRSLSERTMTPATGIFRVGMLNNALPTDPKSFAQSLGQKLNADGSPFAEAVRRATGGSSVLLDNFEVMPLQEGGIGSLKNVISRSGDVVSFDSILPNSGAPTDILSSLSNFF